MENYSPPQTNARPWRVIAEEAYYEPDPERMLELITELNQALDEQILSPVSRGTTWRASEEDCTDKL
jgi:hypothetical protein